MIKEGGAKMVEYVKDRRYLATHEWVKPEGDEAVAGISDYAQHELSDVVYVELPEVGDTFAQGETFAVVESVKAASDVYLPMSGEILAVNEELEDSPQLVNEDPFGKGWFARFRASKPEEYESLMDAEAYEKHCQEEAEKGG
jgi:glycine cleavage system H protein